MEEKDKIIKDNEVAALVSILQAKLGPDLARLWNADIAPMQPIFDAGDARPALRSCIQQWRNEMDRAPKK